MRIRIRLAQAGDIPRLQELIQASVRGLQAGDYSAAQLENALRTVYGVDTRLISDGTYFAAQETESSEGALLAGCGGWSKRTTLYGGDQWKEGGKEGGKAREDSLLDPGEGCGEDSSLLCASGVGAARNWRHDSQGL